MKNSKLLAEEAFEKIIYLKHPNIQAALVAMKPETGEVTALVGGRIIKSRHLTGQLRPCVSRGQPSNHCFIMQL